MRRELVRGSWRMFIGVGVLFRVLGGRVRRRDAPATAGRMPALRAAWDWMREVGGPVAVLLRALRATPDEASGATFCWDREVKVPTLSRKKRETRMGHRCV